MAGIQTSRITTEGGVDLTIQPAAGKKTLVKSVDSTNPGTTPIATAADGELKRLDINALQSLTEAQLADNDLLMVQDVSDGGAIKTIKKTEVRNIRSGEDQPPFGDPLPAESLWVDKKSVLAVKAGGNGSNATLKNSVEFAVINNTFNQSDKNVELGNLVKVRWIAARLASAAHGQIISGTLYAKSGSSFTQTWNLTIIKRPTAGWSIPPLIGQPVSTSVNSSLVVPTGMNAPSPVTIDGGGTLTNIKVSINGGGFTATPGNILSGQTIQVQGTTGAANDTTYTANVSIGGLQQTWNVTTAGSGAFVLKPSVVTPVDGSDDLIASTITFASSPYAEVGGAGAHQQSDWELKQGGSVVASSMGSTTNLLSWKPAAGTMVDFATYTVRVKHRSDQSIESEWSDEITFETGDSTLNPGDELGGGYFGGYISMSKNEVPTHALIVCPRQEGSLKGENQSAAYKSPFNGWDSPRPPSNYEAHGFEPTKQNTAPQYKGFNWVTKDATGPNAGAFNTNGGTGIGGYNDWYAFSRAEAMVIYKNLKPTTEKNLQNNTHEGWGLGYSPYQCQPYAYSEKYGWSVGNPGETDSRIFKGPGGSESLYGMYWTSTENEFDVGNGHSPHEHAYSQKFTGNGNATDPPGGQNTGISKDHGWMWRGIRRIPA